MSNSYYTNYKYNVIISGVDNYTDLKLQQLTNLDNIKESYILYKTSYGGKVLDNNKINYYEDLNNSDVLVNINLMSLKNMLKNLI